MPRFATWLRCGAVLTLVLVAPSEVRAAPTRVVARLVIEDRMKGAPRIEGRSPKYPPAEYPLRGEEVAPPGYRVEYRSRKAPLIAGVFLGGMAYVGGFAIAAGNGFENSEGWLALPVAGPWITLVTRHYNGKGCWEWGDGASDCQTVTGIVLDGSLQIAAATLLTVAFAAPRRWAVRQSPTSSIQITPLVASGTYGLTLAASL